jgi:hypothetical protein
MKWSGSIAPPFIISALDGYEWSASRPGRFTPMETNPGTHLQEVMCAPEPVWREEINLFPSPGIEPRLLIRLARSLVAIPTELSRLVTMA